MAFLDNSGDIILDAVLTDAGRKRLARSDGTFHVSKYAFGDDEIDYGSFDSAHDSGSAYFDLEILQTPILEAFTNNRSSLKSRLLSISNNNLLFLPQLVLNENDNQTLTKRTPESGDGDDFQPLSSGSFLVSVDKETNTELNNADNLKGRYINGNQVTVGGNYIRIDQGLETNKLNASNKLSSELTEQSYMIQLDHRLGRISDLFGNPAQPGSPSFIDDDQIATYYVTRNVGGYVEDCVSGDLEGEDSVADQPHYEVIEGPRGTKLRFGILASSNLKAGGTTTGGYLFETIGTTPVDFGQYGDFATINTTVKVTGISTGYSLDIPITFVKHIDA